jgi:tryptophan halogenase
MSNRIQKVVVVGGGSAGFLSAVALRRLVPEVSVTLVHSPNVPVIGVGESTTSYLPSFLHDTLGLDRREFYAEVRPSWKMGVHFNWGAKQDSHFNYSFDLLMDQEGPPLQKKCAFYCLEDWRDAGPFSAAMDRGVSPCVLDHRGSYFVQPNAGYHIENERFLAYLQRKAQQLGTEIVAADVVDVVRQESGNVKSLRLADGQELCADLFVDASGFRSLLLEKTMGERYVSYRKSLYCDSAVVGSWPRQGDILPYTTTDTMNHGWCWQIEFLDHVTRGYVFSSQFCEPVEAMAEMKEKNPELGDDLRLVRFKSGRYENFWNGNVAAIGNASGFVEPLEATALHLIAEQLLMLCGTLNDTDLRINPEMIRVNNHYFRERWDDVRNFLALHYKFNQKLDTPFWQHCRETTDLCEAQALVDFYQVAGPTLACSHFIPRSSIFAYNGYMIILIEQRVPTSFQNEFSPDDHRRWDHYRNAMRSQVTTALPMRQAMQMVLSPQWQWPTRGV